VIRQFADLCGSVERGAFLNQLASFDELNLFLGRHALFHGLPQPFLPRRAAVFENRSALLG